MPESHIAMQKGDIVSKRLIERDFYPIGNSGLRAFQATSSPGTLNYRESKCNMRVILQRATKFAGGGCVDFLLRFEPSSSMINKKTARRRFLELIDT